MDGYAVVEPTCLDSIVSNPKLDAAAGLILAWLARELSLRLGWEIDVIRVTYVGSYNALGVRRCSAATYAEIVETIEQHVETLFQERTINELIEYISRRAEAEPEKD